MEKIVNRLLGVTFVLALLFGAGAYMFRNSEHDTIAEGEREFDLCEYIDVDLQRLDVTVIPYDGEELRVKYKNDLPLLFELGDNKLSITESTEFVVSLFAGQESEFGLYLYLPKVSFRDVKINTGQGTVRIGRVDCGKLSVLTESGDILCDDMVSLCRLTTSSGHISVDFEYVVDGCEILSRRGNVDMTLPPESSVAVDFRTDTGECETDLWSGKVRGSYVYSFNGGSRSIAATVERGVLTIG